MFLAPVSWKMSLCWSDRGWTFRTIYRRRCGCLGAKPIFIKSQKNLFLLQGQLTKSTETVTYYIFSSSWPIQEDKKQKKGTTTSTTHSCATSSPSLDLTVRPVLLLCDVIDPFPPESPIPFTQQLVRQRRVVSALRQRF